jgi:hypothetical protein
MEEQVKKRLTLVADSQEYYGSHIEFDEKTEGDLAEDRNGQAYDYGIEAEGFVDTPDGLRSFFRALVDDLCKDGDEYAEVRKGDAADFLKAISDPNTGDEIAERAIANMAYAHGTSGSGWTLVDLIADDPPRYMPGNELNVMGRGLAPWMVGPEKFERDAKEHVLANDSTKDLRVYRSLFGDPTASAVTAKRKAEAKRRIEEARKRAAKARRELASAQKALEKAQAGLAAAMGIAPKGEKR